MLLPGNEVTEIALHEDGFFVEKAALLISNEMFGTPTDEWPETVTDDHKMDCRRYAKRVLAMVEDLNGKWIFVVKTPGADDGNLIREFFDAERGGAAQA